MGANYASGRSLGQVTFVFAQTHAHAHAYMHTCIHACKQDRFLGTRAMQALVLRDR